MVASERGSEAFANECLSSQYVMSILIPYESLVVYFLIPAVVYFLRYNTCSRLVLMTHNNCDLIKADKLRRVPVVFPLCLVPGGRSLRKVCGAGSPRPEAVARPVHQSLSYRKQRSPCLPPFFPPNRGQAARVQFADAKFLGTEVSWHIWSWHNRRLGSWTTHDDIKNRGDSSPTRTLTLSMYVS